MTKANRPGLYLVIHINAFTHQIQDGYTMRDGHKVEGSAMTRARLIAYLADNPSVQVSALYV
jgi:hypothetical protein